MNQLVIDQLNELARQLGWIMCVVKDDEGRTVMISIGEEPWLDEFFGMEE